MGCFGAVHPPTGFSRFRCRFSLLAHKVRCGGRLRRRYNPGYGGIEILKNTDGWNS